MSLYERNLALLKASGIAFREVEHEPVLDYEAAAAIRERFALTGKESKSVFLKCRFELRPPRPRDAPERPWDHHWRRPDGAISLSCARDESGYRLGLPGLATFRISADGGSIACHPRRGLPEETLEHLLIDQVMPRVATHRGRLVLHAGCVAGPRGAIAFLGDSGSGKSTLCAALSRQGLPLVGDDGILVRPAPGGGFSVIATYPSLRLHADPLTRMFGPRAAGARVAPTGGKWRLRCRDLEVETSPRPLAALYVLETGTEVRIGPMTGQEAFTALLRASFQLHLRDAERSREMFERLALLAEAVPVRRLSYPRDFGRLPAVRDAILDDARSSGTRR